MQAPGDGSTPTTRTLCTSFRRLMAPLLLIVSALAMSACGDALAYNTLADEAGAERCDGIGCDDGSGADEAHTPSDNLGGDEAVDASLLVVATNDEARQAFASGSVSLSSSQSFSSLHLTWDGEAPGLSARTTGGVWQPVEITFADGRKYSGTIDLAAPATTAELRVDTAQDLHFLRVTQTERGLQ